MHRAQTIGYANLHRRSQNPEAGNSTSNDSEIIIKMANFGTQLPTAFPTLAWPSAVRSPRDLGCCFLSQLTTARDITVTMKINNARSKLSLARIGNRRAKRNMEREENTVRLPTKQGHSEDGRRKDIRQNRIRNKKGKI